MATFESETVAWVDPYVVELTNRINAKRTGGLSAAAGVGVGGLHSDDGYGAYGRDDDYFGSGGGVLDLEDDTQRALYEKLQKMHRHREESSVGSRGVLEAMQANGSRGGAGGLSSPTVNVAAPANAQLPAVRTENLLDNPPEHAYTHVACANDTFVAVSARSGLVHFFDKEDAIPRHSLRLYGVAGLKDCGVPPSSALATSAVTAGSGGISGVQGSGFFSNLATLGAGVGSVVGVGADGGAEGVGGRAVDERDPVVNLLLDPIGRHAVVIFASGVAVVYHIRRTLTTNFDGDEEHEGEKKNKKKKKAKKGILGLSSSGIDVEMKPFRYGFNISNEANGIVGFTLESIGWNLANTAETTTDTVIFGSRSGGVLCTGSLGQTGVAEPRHLFTFPSVYSRAGPITSIAQYVDDSACTASTSGARSAVVLVAQGNRLFYFSSGPIAAGGLRSQGSSATADAHTVLRHVFSPFVNFTSSLPNSLVLPVATSPAKHHSFFSTVVGERSGGAAGSPSGPSSSSGARGRAAAHQESVARSCVPTASSVVNFVLPFSVLSQRKLQEFEQQAGRGGEEDGDDVGLDAALEELNEELHGKKGEIHATDRSAANAHNNANAANNEDYRKNLAGFGGSVLSIGNSVMRYGRTGRIVRGYRAGGPFATGALRGAGSAAAAGGCEVPAESVGADSPLNDPPMCFMWSYDHWCVTGIVNLGLATVSPATIAHGLTSGAGSVVHGNNSLGGGRSQTIGGANASVDSLEIYKAVEESGVSRLVTEMNLSLADGGSFSQTSGANSAGFSSGAPPSSPFYAVPPAVVTVVNALDVAALVGGYEALQWQSRNQSMLLESQGSLSSGLRSRMGVGSGSFMGGLDRPAAIGSGRAGDGGAAQTSLLSSAPLSYSPTSFYALDRILSVSSTYFHMTITTTRKQYTIALPPFLNWEAANAVPNILDRSAPSLVATQRNIMHGLIVPSVFSDDPHSFIRREGKALSSCVTSLLLSVSATFASSLPSSNPYSVGGGESSYATGSKGVGIRNSTVAGKGGSSSLSGAALSGNSATLVNTYRPFGEWPPPPETLTAMLRWSGSLRALTEATNGPSGIAMENKSSTLGFLNKAASPKTPAELLQNPTFESYTLVANAVAKQAAHEMRNRMLFETNVLGQAQRAAIAQMEIAASGASPSSAASRSVASPTDPSLQDAYQQLSPLQAAIGTVFLISQTPAASLAPAFSKIYGNASPAEVSLLLLQNTRASCLFGGATILEPSDMFRYYLARFGGKGFSEVILLPHRKHFAQMFVAAAKRCTKVEASLILHRSKQGTLFDLVRASSSSPPTSSPASSSQPISTLRLRGSASLSPINPSLVAFLAPLTTATLATSSTVGGGAVPYVSGTLLFNLALMLVGTPLRLSRQDPFRRSQFATIRSHLFSVAATPSAAGAMGGAGAALGRGGEGATTAGMNPAATLLGNIGLQSHALRQSALAAARGASAASSAGFVNEQMSFGLSHLEEEDLLASLSHVRNAHGLLMMNQLFLNLRYQFAQYLQATHRPLQAARHFASSTAADTKLHLSAAVRASRRGKEKKSPYAGLAGSSNSFNSAMLSLVVSSSSVGSDPSDALLVAIQEKSRILARTRTEQNKAIHQMNVFGDGDEEAADDEEDEGYGHDNNGKGTSRSKRKRRDPPPAASPVLHCLNTFGVEMLIHECVLEEQGERLQYRRLAYNPEIMTALLGGGGGLTVGGGGGNAMLRKSSVMMGVEQSNGNAHQQLSTNLKVQEEERNAKQRHFRHAFLASTTASFDGPTGGRLIPNTVSGFPSSFDMLENRLKSHYGITNSSLALQSFFRRARRTLSWAASQKDVFAMGVDAAIIHFCAHMQRYEELLQYQISNDRHFEAVIFLINFCSADINTTSSSGNSGRSGNGKSYKNCWIRHSYELIRKYPVRMVQDGWIRRGMAAQLNPLALIPAIMAYRPEYNDSRRFAEGNAQALIEELEYQRLLSVIKREVGLQRAVDSERNVPAFRQYGHLHKPSAELARLSRRGRCSVGAAASRLRRSSLAFVSSPMPNSLSSVVLPRTPFAANGAGGRARSLSTLLSRGGAPVAARHGSAMFDSQQPFSPVYINGNTNTSIMALRDERVTEHQGIAFLRHVLGATKKGIMSGGGAQRSMISLEGHEGKHQPLYNLLLHLLATSHESVSDAEVVEFIESAPRAALDRPYAYRTCMANGRLTGALHILFSLGFFDEAVDQALLLRDVVTAVAFIKKLRRVVGGSSSVSSSSVVEAGRTRRRELWKKVIAFVAEDKVSGAQNALNLIAESNGDINVSHVLPFLSDEVNVSTFKNELDQNVRVFGSDLNNLQVLISQSERETEGLKAERRVEAALRYTFDQITRCASCHQQVITDRDRRPIFFRRCRHAFHAGCFNKGLLGVHVARSLLDDDHVSYSQGHMRPPCEGDLIALSNHVSSNTHRGLRLQPSSLARQRGRGNSAADLRNMYDDDDGSNANRNERAGDGDEDRSGPTLEYPLPPLSTECPSAGEQPNFIPHAGASQRKVSEILTSTRGFNNMLSAARAVVEEGYLPASAQDAITLSFGEVNYCVDDQTCCFLCDAESTAALLEGPITLPVVNMAKGLKLASVYADMSL